MAQEQRLRVQTATKDEGLKTVGEGRVELRTGWKTGEARGYEGRGGGNWGGKEQKVGRVSFKGERQREMMKRGKNGFFFFQERNQLMGRKKKKRQEMK